MALVYGILSAFSKIHDIEKAEAHCDIPCGIYDPHMAQLAAHTVIRMTDMLQKLTSMSSSPEENKKFAHDLARLTAIKEEHAEIVKREIRVIWGDYFKPEHLLQYPHLHDLAWNIMKLSSKSRQQVDMEVAKELLEKVLEFSEIFWKTKGIETYRVKSPYPSGGEIVQTK
jgi:nickel superoxide dismutase